MIVVTGAAGFIGSYMVGKLNRENYRDVVLVDKFDDPRKISNYISKTYTSLIDRDVFFGWLAKNHPSVQCIIHLGARTDTVGQEPEVYRKLNFDYSKRIWESCTEYGLPLIYASSASTYGDGSLGFNDEHEKINRYQPLNLYAQSKHDFDCWALRQKEQPKFWAGLKFFNVFGPNEYHKDRMASVVYQAFNQISASGNMGLFCSHRADCTDGHQSRDFIYVEDVVKVILYFMRNPNFSGIYNVGTGISRTYIDLAKAVFNAMEIPEKIEFIETPPDIRGKYQYYTCADIKKLRESGYIDEFMGLEDAVNEYINCFLDAEYCY